MGSGITTDTYEISPREAHERINAVEELRRGLTDFRDMDTVGGDLERRTRATARTPPLGSQLENPSMSSGYSGSHLTILIQNDETLVRGTDELGKQVILYHRKGERYCMRPHWPDNAKREFDALVARGVRISFSYGEGC